MSREFENLSQADMKALSLARAWGISIDHESASLKAQDAQLPRDFAGPLREVVQRQIRDRDGKPWRARDAGQLFANNSFIDRASRQLLP